MTKQEYFAKRQAARKEAGLPINYEFNRRVYKKWCKIKWKTKPVGKSYAIKKQIAIMEKKGYKFNARSHSSDHVLDSIRYFIHVQMHPVTPDQICIEDEALYPEVIETKLKS